jgi:hypothetical protein
LVVHGGDQWQVVVVDRGSPINLLEEAEHHAAVIVGLGRGDVSRLAAAFPAHQALQQVGGVLAVVDAPVQLGREQRAGRPSPHRQGGLAYYPLLLRILVHACEGLAYPPVARVPTQMVSEIRRQGEAAGAG